MANELKHDSVGITMTQAEFEAVGLHVLDSQATGDLIYASSSSQLTRLAIGSTNAFLQVSGGIPAWTTTPTLGGTVDANDNIISNLYYVEGRTDASFRIYAKRQGAVAFSLYTTGAAAGFADTLRLQIGGASDLTFATWSNVTHTGVKLTGANNAFGSIVLPTGTGKTVDNVITELQNLGLVTQS